MTDILWQPSAAAIKSANMTRFREYVCERYSVELEDYNELYQWSLTETEKFWLSVWEWCDVVASNRGDRVVIDREKMPGASWFPDAQLNFAENLLQKSGSDPALVFRSEDNTKRTISS